ncbi:MAG: class I SAM-dependent methyltransferase [Acidobacteriaceae bacterium]|nr:class I SAM-dependent methyltransferase [Acidobacteriaceae bacterium]
MTTAPQPPSSDTGHIWISQPGGRSNCYSDPEGRFSIIAAGRTDAQEVVRMEAYSAAMAFVNGKFDVHGDILAAIRHFSKQPHSRFRDKLFSVLARLEHLRIYSRFGGRDKSADNIQFHYDRSNEFYAQFLDSRMIYSEASFEDPEDSLERAQTRKLDRICRDLALRPGERFLDIGCGWGGLISYAVEHYGVAAHGCTLSSKQLNFARTVIERAGVQDRTTVSLCDYRDLEGRFDKIASVGMFEHVGRGRLQGYFAKVHALLNEGGLFLNRGIVRPEGVPDSPETFFIQKQVFPGGELVHLSDVIREAERAGFEPVGLQDLRIHYARTCAAWVKNLQSNAVNCRALVGDRAYRTWVLYLAGSAVAFEQGRISATQVLLAKRGELSKIKKAFSLQRSRKLSAFSAQLSAFFPRTTAQSACALNLFRGRSLIQGVHPKLTDS